MLKVGARGIVDFTNFDLDQLFGMGDGSNPLLMLVWILPIILFVFYGQRIQLYVTAGEIKKAIKKLDAYRSESRDALLVHVRKEVRPAGDPAGLVSRFIDYFTIMPVDMDPAGIIPKIKHVVRSREDTTRRQVRALSPDMDDVQEARTQALLEIASSLQMIHKTVNHMFLTAKRQNNYPLILPLQMVLPFVLEQAGSLRDAIPAIRRGQPLGDGIGPMVVGRMMLGLPKEDVALNTVLAKDAFEGRRVLLLKARGPAPVVGRPSDVLQSMVQTGGEAIHAIIMIDAALKMEGEESATVSHGFGAAIGGIGTERFEIEDYASSLRIPVYSIVVKESVRDAITVMTREIAEKADEVREQVYEAIRENAEKGQTVLIIGVGNTAGVAQ